MDFKNGPATVALVIDLAVHHEDFVRGVNLTDKLSYNSVSRFRFDVPLPGGGVGVAYRLEF